MGCLDGLGLLVVDDHVFFMLPDGTHLATQLGHVADLGKRVGHEMVAHRVDAKHAQHACATQQSKQNHHHPDGAEHPHASQQPVERVIA
jgi:hypothetical protein